VQPLQVDEHADDDLLAGGRGEQRAIVGRLVAEVLAKELPAIDLGEQRAAVEGIDDQVVDALLANRANEEMAGKVDPLEPDTGSAPDLDVDDGEADWNPGTAVEHFVQEAVARVVVVVAVAAESQLLGG